MIRQSIVAEALSWEGTPYHHHGRIKGVGVDCAMILAEVYHAVGLLGHANSLESMGRSVNAPVYRRL